MVRVECKAPDCKRMFMKKRANSKYCHGNCMRRHNNQKRKERLKNEELEELKEKYSWM